MEKIHGTSCNISYKENTPNNAGNLTFFSGGVSYDSFVKLFNQEQLLEKFKGIPEVTVYGEGYGGSCQKMSDVYGKELKFVAFDVKVGDCWLRVPDAEIFVKDLGLEFVDYVQCSTSLEDLDRERDKESVQAIRNGMGNGKQREGVVIRPLLELTKNNGERVIVKHKQEKFRETATVRPVSEDKLKVLSDAQAVADEWATFHRLEHILQKIENPSMEKMKEIMSNMREDIKREGDGEIIWSDAVEKAIGKKTAELMKTYCKSKLNA